MPEENALYTIYNISYKRGNHAHFGYASVSSTSGLKSVSLLERWLKERGLGRNFKAHTVKETQTKATEEDVIMNFDETMLTSDCVERELYQPYLKLT